MRKWIRSSHTSSTVWFQSAFPSLTTSPPPPPPSLLLLSPSILPHLLFSLTIPVSILPCPFSCNPSVISLCVFIKYVCFGEYGFMHACVLGLYHCLQRTSRGEWLCKWNYVSYNSQICIESIINQQFLTHSLPFLFLSTTTREVTSVTYPSTCPLCGMETLSLTTHPTFKVQTFFFNRLYSPLSFRWSIVA